MSVAKLNSFFENWIDSKISIEELSEKLSIPVDSLEQLLSKRTLKAFKANEIFLSTQYFDQNNKELFFNGLSRLDDNFDSKYHHKKLTIRNRYPLNTERSMDLFLAKTIFGVNIVKGEVDRSDCGGLYTSIWAYTAPTEKKPTDSSNEVPFFHEGDIISLYQNAFPWLDISLSIKNRKTNLTIKLNNTTLVDNHQVQNYVEITQLLSDKLKGTLVYSLSNIEGKIKNNDPLVFDSLKDATQYCAKNKISSYQYLSKYVNQVLPTFISKEEAVDYLKNLNNRSDDQYMIIGHMV